MDPQAQVIASLIVGYAMQWGRGVAKFPDPLVYLVSGLLGIGILFLASPNPTEHGWRNFIWTGVVFLFAIRGFAGASGDAKIAPKSNTL